MAQSDNMDLIFHMKLINHMGIVAEIFREKQPVNLQSEL